MQKLKNKTSGVEYIITGVIGVPREIDENTFEVWTHFSVDTDGDGQIETIEVPPVDPEWEVIEVPDPVVEPEPQEELAPIPEQTDEEKALSLWLEKFQLLEKSLRAKKKLEDVGLSFSAEEQARFDALVAWVSANRKIEYVQYM